MTAWHDQFGVSANHSYFVIAGNPNNDGGGVIMSTDDWRVAWDTMKEAERRGYKDVEILSAKDFWCMKDEER